MMDTDVDIEEVYEDRNLLALAFLATRAEASYLAGSQCEMGWWDDDGSGDDWVVVWAEVHIGGEEAQVGWHVPKEAIPPFLPERDPDYDGYSDTEKRNRLRKYIYGVNTTVRQGAVSHD